ncbi:hypothetical protein PM082_023983 [Marasmius tenuissimus]|nr:hypothetical protein PM082_023983 [Marasmius tenuissimus]
MTRTESMLDAVLDGYYQLLITQRNVLGPVSSSLTTYEDGSMLFSPFKELKNSMSTPTFIIRAQKIFILNRSSIYARQLDQQDFHGTTEGPFTMVQSGKRVDCGYSSFVQDRSSSLVRDAHNGRFLTDVDNKMPNTTSLMLNKAGALI